MDDYLNQVRGQVLTTTRNLVTTLLDDAQGDVEQFLTDIQEHLTIAVARGDDQWIQELTAQSGALAKKHSLAARAGGYAVFTSVLGIALGALSGGLGYGLRQLSSLAAEELAE